MKKIILLLFFSLFLLCGCSSKEPVEQKTFVLDTIVSITIYDAEHMEEAKKIIDDCFQQCKTYENMFSRTIEGSDIYNINHAKGQPVSVSPETAYLIETAIKYSIISNGSFDISIAPVSSLWDFHAETPKPPAADMVAEQLQYVGYENIHVDGTTVTLAQAQCAIDLGGIAKGYIADQLYSLLQERGVKSAIIDLGGNIMTVGGKTDKEPFHIGIKDPFQNTGDIIGAVPAMNLSLVTSGIYERFFIFNDTLYHHILNPKTGYPIDSDLASVTVFSPHSIDGDALSTASFVMGLEDGLALINTLKDIEAIFITKDGQYIFSDGINKTILFDQLP